jgi:hypothetical protein
MRHGSFDLGRKQSFRRFGKSLTSKKLKLSCPAVPAGLLSVAPIGASRSRNTLQPPTLINGL